MGYGPDVFVKDVDLRRNPWRVMYKECKKRIKEYSIGGFIMIYGYTGEENVLSKKLTALSKRYTDPSFLAREERFRALHNVVKSFVPNAYFSPPILNGGDDCGWVFKINDNIGKIKYPSDDVSVEDFEIFVAMKIL